MSRWRKRGGVSSFAIGCDPHGRGIPGQTRLDPPRLVVIATRGRVLSSFVVVVIFVRVCVVLLPLSRTESIHVRAERVLIAH